MALALAKERGGTVINADAMQVYRDLRILTARPDADEEASVPHALYGHVDGAAAYSVAQWLADVAATIAEVQGAGRLPILVGGTGLYFAALTEGLAPVPAVPEAVRSHWRARQAREAPEALHAELARRDPVMAARLRPSDPQRIVRALEVVEATGRSLATFHAERSRPVLPLGPEVERIVLAPDRAALRRRIATRFETMMEAGALAEAAALADRGLDPSRPVMKAIGVAPLAAHAAGRLDRDAAITRAVAESRQYAKRQETWFRNRFPDWPRRAPDFP